MQFPLSYILMTFLDHFLETLPLFLPVLLTLALVSTGLWTGYWFFSLRNGGLKEEARFSARVGMLLLIGMGVVLILLALPLDKETHKDLFSTVGLVDHRGNYSVIHHLCL